MTSDKCARPDWRETCEVDFYDGAQKCVHCGKVFVPSDVLEEARKTILRMIRNWESETAGTRDWEDGVEELFTATLARIDAVPGKK